MVKHTKQEPNSNNLEIIISHPNSIEDFAAYYQLRWEILRKPWNQAIGSEKDEFEHSSFHFMAKHNTKIVGVCRIQKNNISQAQIRFMAVDIEYQGKGIGKQLIKEAELFAKNELKSKYIILQARENALIFYQLCNFKIVEKTFLLYNSIQHYLMQKSL